MIYSSGYYRKSDGISHWKKGMLRYGDAVCALAYAFGIESFDAVRDMFGFLGNGKDIKPEMPAIEQMNRILANATRTPKAFLDVGTGRGEIAVVLSCFFYSVITIEMCEDVWSWLDKTQNTFGMSIRPTFFFLPFVGTLEKFNTNCSDETIRTLDTVLFVETIEHVLEDEFFAFLDRLVSVPCSTMPRRLVITNWIDYHPIKPETKAPKSGHCTLIDDGFYDKICARCQKVVFRQGSHLVVDFNSKGM